MKKEKLLRELTAKEVADYINELNEKQGRIAVQQFQKNVSDLKSDYSAEMIERMKPYWQDIYDYPDANIFKKLWIYVKALMSSRKAEGGVPKTVLLQIVDSMLPDIRAFFESQEGQEEFAKWKAEKEKEKQNYSENGKD